MTAVFPCCRSNFTDPMDGGLKKPGNFITGELGERSLSSASRPEQASAADRDDLADDRRWHPLRFQATDDRVGLPRCGGNQERSRPDQPQRVEVEVPAKSFAFRQNRNARFKNGQPHAAGLRHFPQARGQSAFGRVVHGMHTAGLQRESRLTYNADSGHVQDRSFIPARASLRSARSTAPTGSRPAGLRKSRNRIPCISRRSRL